MLVDFDLCPVEAALGSGHMVGEKGGAPLSGGAGKSLSLGRGASMEASRVRRRKDVQEEPREVKAGGEIGYRVSCVGRYSFESQPAGPQV